MLNDNYQVLLITELQTISELIDDSIQNSCLLNAQLHLCWIADYSQWQIEYDNQKYDLYIIDYPLFLLLKKNQEVLPKPLIVLTENHESGIDIIRSGATDYWNINSLDRYQIERNLRLVLNFSLSSTNKQESSKQNFYQDFFNNFTEGLFAINVLADGTLTYGNINQSYEKLIKVSQEKIIGKKITTILTPLEERKYRDCLFSQQVVSYESTIVLDGKLSIWLIVLIPIKNKQGNVFQIQGSARNITKEKKALAKQIRQTRYRNFQRSISLKIRQSLNIKNIIATTVTELQKTLHTERVAILRLTKNNSAKVIEESVQPEFSQMLGTTITGDLYQQILSHNYDEGSFYAWNDITTVTLPADYQQLLQDYQVRAQLVIPIIRRSVVHHNLYSNSVTRLWGLLCVHQCSEPRKWQKDEIELLQQLVEQLNIALSQAELLENEVKQRQELARSNAELEQFAYIASHDLQAPLQTISNYAQLIEHRYKDRLDQKADKYINYIVEGVTRMKNQISDLLEFSKVNRQQNTFKETDFRVVIKQAIANLYSEIESTQAHITYSDNLPKLIVDHSQFVTLFQNLISNSLKYRRSIPPQINIGVVQKQDTWQFSVQDNGIGIASEYQERIFQIFQRLHTQDEYPGTGIGLAICQKIVQRHGGNIWVESELEKGSTFYFTILQQKSLTQYT